MDLNRWIREVPDYPQPGVLFRDITPLLAHPPAFRYVVDALVEEVREFDADAIAAIDARGFLFGAPAAFALGLPVIPFRKAGKLPPETLGVDFELEYGTDRIELNPQTISPGARMVIVDDVLATGGTAAGAVSLAKSAGARVQAIAFVIELEALQGRAALPDVEVRSLLKL